MDNRQLDSAELRSLALPYDRLTPELSPNVRLVGGSNMFLTNFGKLAKRPGSAQLGAFAVSSLPGTIDHFIHYETLDSPPKIWLVASVLRADNGLYDVWAVRLDGSGTPASLGTLRNLNASTRPHEFVVSRGICYIKGYPAATGDKLGTVVFNGSTNTTTFWGLLGPQTPATLVGSVSGGVFTQSGWTSSTFPVTVNLGWSYTYTYKTITGQESSRAPLQTNQSLNPSNTGAFTNLCPKMTLTGNSDTTNVPTIVVYRGTDGGGTFYKLQELTNTGGSITFEDRNFPDGNLAPAQPTPDTALNTTAVAPSLTQNAPPPSVQAASIAFTTLTGSLTASNATVVFNSNFNGVSIAVPALPVTVTIDNEICIWTSYVVGSATAYLVRGSGATNVTHSAGATVRLTPVVGNDPVSPSTPIAFYASRFWYGIGNVLFFSGSEEIGQGVPEECWPAGLLGDFYRFNLPIVNLWATSEALYIFCTTETYWLRGNSLDTFQVQKLFADVGAKRNHPRAVCAADKSIIWLTHDLRLCMARGYSRDFISDQISPDITTAVVTRSAALHLTRFANQEKDLVVLAAVTSSAALNQQWVYDFNQQPISDAQSGTSQGLWSTPWTQQVTCVQAGQPFDTTDPAWKLVWGVTNGSGANCYVTSDLTGSTVTDFVAGSAANFAENFTVSLVRNPAGNHANALRLPALVSDFYAAKLERTAFAGDTDPSVNFYFDNLTGSNGTAAPAPETPSRRVQSVGYATLWYESSQACERVSVQVFKSALAERFECQALAFCWNPDKGA